ncbi:Lsr2 family protein [Cellulomonas algicola]|uniref:Lsr2 family protein n=1 Tax=Cellulomonas algicola TaxID=2071633 RepID=A0A401UX77_9CELL|nr:Lsr2 family protein [Cellulomonas algicola]GCD19283.1 Lsr2 family protein [Cellulomonas algicola]
MAQKQIVIVADDLDGSEGAQTYRFAWQSTSYEIDLSDANRDEFLRALEPYITAARRTGRRLSSPSRRSQADTAAVQAWASKNGFELKTRGHIPPEVLAAYDKR